MNLFKKSLLSPAVALLIWSNIYADNISYSIEKQSLKDAIEKISKKANKPYIASGEIFDGKTSNAIKDITGTQNALDEVLKNSGLEAVLEDGAIIIKKKAVIGEGTVLEPISVNEVSLNTTEGTGSYTTERMNTATKLNLSQRDTPQSVSVMTRQQIEDFGYTTLDDAMKNMTGIVSKKGYDAGDSARYNARGFEISNIMLDGMPTSTESNGTYNANNDSLDIYDRVEVVRGATGLTTGTGTPSATVNLVRKKPTKETKGNASLSYGSYDNYRGTFDIGGALNEDKTIRARTVITAEDSDMFYDTAEHKNYQFYSVVEADVNDNLMATLGVHYRKVDNTGGYQGLPTNVDGSFLDVSRKTNLSNDFDYWKQTDKTVFSELEYNFNNDWKAKLAGNWKRPEQDIMFSSLSRISGDLYQGTQGYKLDNKQDSYDVLLNGPYSLFGRNHELMLGADYRKFENRNWGGWANYTWSTNGPLVDPYNWNSSSVSKPYIDMNKWKYDFDLTQKSTYLATRLNLTDSLNFILGSRLSWYENENLGTNTTYKATAEVVPYAGIVYDLDDNHSIYTSWTQIFQPQSSKDRNGDLLEPITGTNYEAGIKGEYFDGRLNANIATFLIKQQNRATDDLTGPNPCPGSTWGFCKRASGEVESKGFETEISGAITDSWQLIAGYTYVETEYTKDVDSSNVGKIFDLTLPKQQFKLSTTYKLPVDSNKWTIGANIYAQNDIKSNDFDKIKQSGYYTVGVNTKYQYSKNLDVLLNVYNLFDEEYYQTLGWDTGGNVVGTPRTFLLSMNMKF
ncbi:TonB-dependent siderophore receptor [Aliarcobacter butzleri]|uniref:TonB-dependent siderophore receptor n=1 Tax=Aliarcobacter butzleri TaxID=28197 RepID=UPI00263D3F4F|nr:TonB-dependent siderophore receptor [Aliarcobacter butzleri]MDN5058751.1 TonB-dependent siderophore receptor [Aliarcobacter butzleri]MDN5109124.1 TonB-dependent siderophore receptor [Aliarcobacter butzleri]